MKTQLSTLLLFSVVGCGRADVVAEIELPNDFNGLAQVADLDNDGDLDLAIPSFTGVNIIPSQGGQFLEPTASVISNTGNVFLADLDGDSLPEILTSDGI